MVERSRKKIKEFSEETGSYTLEAAVILSVTIVLILLVIYAMFSIHDRIVCLSQGLSEMREALQYRSEPVDEEGRLDTTRLSVRLFKDSDEEKPMSEKWAAGFLNKAEAHLLTGRIISCEVQEKNRRLSLDYQGEFSFFANRLAEEAGMPAGSFSRSISLKEGMAPEKILRICRGILWRKE